MANIEQAERLRRGVEEWNAWRMDNPDMAVDLKNANFDNANLEGVLLFEADLQGARFRKANLQGADFRHANLMFADFIGANLDRANLDDSNIQDADFTKASMDGARWDGTMLKPREIRSKNNGAAVTIVRVELTPSLSASDAEIQESHNFLEDFLSHTGNFQWSQRQSQHSDTMLVVEYTNVNEALFFATSIVRASTIVKFNAKIQVGVASGPVPASGFSNKFNNSVFGPIFGHAKLLASTAGYGEILTDDATRNKVEVSKDFNFHSSTITIPDSNKVSLPCYSVRLDENTQRYISLLKWLEFNRNDDRRRSAINDGDTTIQLDYHHSLDKTEQNTLSDLIAALQDAIPGISLSLAGVETTDAGQRLSIRIDDANGRELTALRAELQEMAERLQAVQQDLKKSITTLEDAQKQLRDTKAELNLEQSARKTAELKFKHAVLEKIELEKDILRSVRMERIAAGPDLLIAPVFEDGVYTVLYFDLVKFSECSEAEAKIAAAALDALVAGLQSIQSTHTLSKWTGDGFVAAYQDVNEALHVALLCMKTLESWSLPGRMGVATGFVEFGVNKTEEGMNFSGATIVTAARQEAAATAYEILTDPETKLVQARTATSVFCFEDEERDISKSRDGSDIRAVCKLSATTNKSILFLRN